MSRPLERRAVIKINQTAELSYSVEIDPIDECKQKRSETLIQLSVWSGPDNVLIEWIPLILKLIFLRASAVRC